MPTVTISTELLLQLGKLAKPFIEKEPADVIQRLVSEHLRTDLHAPARAMVRAQPEPSNIVSVVQRLPRERGAHVVLDGFEIRADSVPDLIKQLAERVSDTGRWPALVALAPYKTSPERFLF